MIFLSSFLPSDLLGRRVVFYPFRPLEQDESDPVRVLLNGHLVPACGHGHEQTDFLKASRQGVASKYGPLG